MATGPQYNWPRIVTALCGIGLAGGVFYIELDLFLNVRASALSDASTDAFFDVGADSACVGYADAKKVSSVYSNGKQNAIRPFGIFSIGGDDVACGEGSAADTLAALVAASVHALEYNRLHPPTLDDAAAQDALVEALGYTADAARCAALGTSVALSYDDAVLALGKLEPPPTNCSKIYVGASLSESVHEPVLEPQETDIDLLCGEGTQSPSCALSADYKNELLTHCVRQFQLGRFAPDVDAYSMAWVSGLGGTMGLPVYGQVLNPDFLPWRNPPNLTDDKPWDQRTRVLYGVRYGLSVWSAMPVFFLTTFLVFDCVMILLSQMTKLENLRATLRTASTDAGSVKRAERIILSGIAGMLAMRRERRLVFGFGFVAAVLMRTLFSFLPWNAGRLLPRATCAEGGWESDEPAFELEVISLVLLLFGTLLQPLVTSTGIENNEFSRTNVQKGVDVVENVGLQSQVTQTRGWTSLVIIGALVCFGVQAMIATIYGEAWVGRILNPDPEDTWSLSKYADAIFAKSLGALGIALSAGIALAAIISRWKFPGRNTNTLIVLVVWAVASLLALLPLFLIEGFSFDPGKFAEDCDKTADEGACNVRFFAYYAGVATFLLPLGIALVGCVTSMALVPAQERHFRGLARVLPSEQQVLSGAMRKEAVNARGGPEGSCADEARRPLLVVRGENGWGA